MKIDLDRYVGKPYEQPFGCFMLVRQVLMDQGVFIPDYTDGCTEELQTHAQRARAFMCHLEGHAVEVSHEPREEGDVVLLRIGPWASHIGIWLPHNGGIMLHTINETGAVLERLDSIRWRNRILGYWRVQTQ